MNISKAVFGTMWTVEHWRGDKLIQSFSKHNMVPNEFINHWLDVTLSDGTAYSAWYVLLFEDDYTPLATNTYATPGFTESDDYTGDRPAWTEAGASSQSITNSASKASFTMGGTDDIYGAALVNYATKDDQAYATGIMGPIVKFSSAVSGLDANDVLKVYITLTGSSQA